MQDENVTCRDLDKVSFERALGCFGTYQHECATRFPMPLTAIFKLTLLGRKLSHHK